MKVGDMIRVKGWPGTRGRRFEVVEVKGATVFAIDHGRLAAFRAFPLERCAVDTQATEARKARAS